MAQRIRRGLAVIAMLGVTVLTSTAVASPAVPATTATAPPQAPAQGGPGAPAVRHHPGSSAKGTVCGAPYVENDQRLGPQQLPKTGEVAKVLHGYVRFGGIPYSRFLNRYWNETATPPGWRYPPDDGFAHDGGYVNGRPLRSAMMLAAGAELDRFGSEYGSYLADKGTPFAGRALPPDSLNTRADDPTHPCNYHVYRVAKSFQVPGGPAEPAFQQAGAGRQYRLESSYIPGAPTPVNVRWLVDNGYLTRVI